MTSFIILGSGSPRRRELLQQLHQPFAVVLPANEVDETPHPHESPQQLVQRLSQIKGSAVAQTIANQPSIIQQTPIYHYKTEQVQFKQIEQLIIITADTTVAQGNDILNKPQDAISARRMLTQLRDNPHYVYSGVSLVSFTMKDGLFNKRPNQQITHLHESKVFLRPFTEAELSAYIESGDPFDKAGGYGIQNKSFAPVSHFEGCFASIMGFPLAQITNTLADWGLILPSLAPICEQHNHHPCCLQTS